MTSPTFEQTWKVPALGQHVAPGAGRCVFDGDAKSSSVPDGVAEVFCDGDFALDAPRAGVERLTVWRQLSGDLAGLSSLGELTAEWFACDLSGLPQSVDSLAVHPKSLGAAPALPGLKRLRLYHRCRTAADLDRYPALEWLMFAPSRQVAAELRSLEQLTRLELRLNEASLSSLAGLGRKERLSEVLIDGPGLKSLRGISAWPALATLTLTQTGLEDLSPLAECAARELVLELPTRQRVNDFSPLGSMAHLKELTLVVPWGLDDLSFLASAPSLKSVTITDTPLSSKARADLLAIDRLERVTLTGTGQTKAKRRRHVQMGESAAPPTPQPTFEDLWERPGIAALQPRPGVAVLPDRDSRASQLAGDEHTVYVTGWAGEFAIDTPLPSVVRLFVNEDVSGDFSAMPALRELRVGRRAEDFSGLVPTVEKLALWRPVSTVPASESLRKLSVQYTSEELCLERFPKLQWLSVTPRIRAAAELRAVELLVRLELGLEVARLAKLSLIGAKDRLEYLRVDGGGLASAEGVERFAELRTAQFRFTGVRDFRPLTDSRVEDLRILHRKPTEDEFLGLGEMPALRRLHLELAAGVTLERVADLHRAPALETVDFGESGLGDTVIESIAKIETLERVVMLGGTKAQAGRLAAARPDIEIVGGAREAALTALQVVEFDGEWSIFGDIAGLIDAPTNYAAETRIRAVLKPEVLSRLSFDTEAGMFSAQSTDRSAMDAVAEAVERLSRTAG